MVDCDVAVIGSGVGGLSAAVAFARAGLRVQVFEQHWLPGGWSQSFTREGYQFSPGVHYIGEVHPDGPMGSLFRGLGLGNDLSFFRQNVDGYEHAFIAGERFDFPAGRRALERSLVDRFPSERAGLGRYFDTIDAMYGELRHISSAYGASGPLSIPIRRIPTLARHAWRRYSKFLNDFTTDERLRAVLSIQAGDHCMPLEACPSILHTAVTSHYMEGGYFPKGGGGAISHALIEALRRHGGDIQLSTSVDRILIRDGRAVGVRLADGTEVSASRVISDADPGVTWGTLVDREHYRFRDRVRMRVTGWSPGSMSLFFAVDCDVRELGIDSGNIWYSRTHDVSETYRFARRDPIPSGPLPGFYLGCSSLKDPSARQDGHHTFEMFSFVSSDPFQCWADSKPDDRPKDYLALKQAYTDRMFDALDEVIPGLRDAVVFKTLGTPLTNQRYIRATRGAIYGTERYLRSVGPFGWPIQTHIPGLFQVGASTLSQGVYGAARSGLIAAELALDCSLEDLLDQRAPPIRIEDAEGFVGAPVA